MLSELTPEQITAVAAGVAAVIIALGKMAQRSANRAPASGDGPLSPLLVLDAKQATLIVEGLGGVMLAADRLRLALERNSDATGEINEEAQKLLASFQQLTLEIARATASREHR